MALLHSLLALICSVTIVGAQNILSIPATGNYIGNDGQWSTFYIQVGTPAQVIEVLVSTTSQQLWVVQPAGCDTTTNVTTCEAARGNVFDLNNSTSWTELTGNSSARYFDLYIGEYLGYGGNAQYGYDTVTLGLPQSNPTTLSNATIGALATFNYFTGFFGLEPVATTFDGFPKSNLSPMQLLKDQGSIASLSYGFNPGAQYKNAGQSLTLGGYDQARYNKDLTLSYNFAPSPARDLTVILDSLSWNGTNVLGGQISMGIDSTFPEIWVPSEVCTAFEEEFGLYYNTTHNLYIVDDGLFQRLGGASPNFTFTLASGDSTQKINITVPYLAFQLQATASFNNLTETTYYFPLQCATNTSQYTLGRAFLQQAYLSVDFERSVFNISAMQFFDQSTQDFVEILPVGGSSASSSSSGLGSGAIAGIVVGVVVGLALLGALVFFFLRRRRAARRAADAEAESEKKRREKEENDSQSSDHAVYFKPELEAPAAPFAKGKGRDSASELDTPLRSPVSAPPVEVGESRQVFEMEGDLPKPMEMDQGKNLSEKEQMIFRERMHNGIDPAESNSPRSPRDEML